MDVRDYEYIVAIADEGNISRAAAALFITQPALTKFLQRTEKQLGVPLFVRRGNQFLPTDAGKAYIEAGREILSIDEQLSAKMSQALAKYKQLIRIGYSMGRTDEILGKILPQFYDHYPEIRVKAAAQSTADNFAALVKGDLDMAMVVIQGCPTGFQDIALTKSWLSLVVREDDPLVGRALPAEGQPFSTVSLSDLKKARFIVTDMSTNSGKYSQRLLAKHNLSGQIVLEVNDTNSCLAAVEAGLGYGLMFSIPLGLRKLKYLSIREIDAIEQTTSLLYPADWKPTLPAQYLIRLIQNCEK